MCLVEPALLAKVLISNRNLLFLPFYVSDAGINIFFLISQYFFVPYASTGIGQPLEGWEKQAEIEYLRRENGIFLLTLLGLSNPPEFWVHSFSHHQHSKRGSKHFRTFLQDRRLFSIARATDPSWVVHWRSSHVRKEEEKILWPIQAMQEVQLQGQSCQLVLFTFSGYIMLKRNFCQASYIILSHMAVRGLRAE